MPLIYSHLTMANSDLQIDDDRAFLPDLRGEFLRGLDLGRWIDVDQVRVLGSSQDSQSALPIHRHELSQEIGRSEGWTGGWGGQENQRAVNGPGDGPILVKNSDESEARLETRPRNIAVNFLIKAE